LPCSIKVNELFRSIGLSLGNPEQTFTRAFKVFATSLFIALDYHFAAIFNNSNVFIAYWNILALHRVFHLHIIYFGFLVLGWGSNHFDELLLILLDDEAQVLDLPVVESRSSLWVLDHLFMALRTYSHS
jgi:hypothetical protein